MWFWFFMLACDMLVPVIMIFAGYMMHAHTPKEINWAIGYRTRRSMKSMETWRFAHEHCGRLWQKTGLIMLVPSLVAHVPVYGMPENVIGTLGTVIMLVQCAVLVISVIPTERALKRRFPENG